MCRTVRTSPSSGTTYTYYRCPHDPANPRQAAACPDHGNVMLREDTLIGAIAGFLDQYLFGHDRAALLATQLPATTAEHATARERQARHLHVELARIDTAERPDQRARSPADPADPATQAYRTRIRARFADLYTERTRTETQLAELQATAPPTTTPARSTSFPPPPVFSPADRPGSKKASSPHSTSRPSTGTTRTRSPSGPPSPATPPRTVAALLADPRTDTHATPSPAAVSHSAPTPIRWFPAHNDEYFRFPARLHRTARPRRRALGHIGVCWLRRRIPDPGREIRYKICEKKVLCRTARP